MNNVGKTINQMVAEMETPDVTIETSLWGNMNMFAASWVTEDTDNATFTVNSDQMITGITIANDFKNGVESHFITTGNTSAWGVATEYEQLIERMELAISRIESAVGIESALLQR